MLRSTYTEWASADESVPINLPDGRVVWVFDDTSVGKVSSNGTLNASNTVVHNSFVVQTGACFAPRMGGAPLARRSLIPDPASNQWYWPTSGVVDTTSNVLRVFMLHEQRTGSGAFAFTLDDVDVATFSLPGITLLSIQPLPFPSGNAKPYGETSFLNTTDGDVYLYGQASRNVYAARAPVGQLLNPSAWTFASGNPNSPSWGPASAATPLQWINIPNFDPGHLLGSGTGPSADPSVINDGSGYLLTSKLANAFSNDVSVFTASSPAGPWTYYGQVANTQQAGTIAYGAYTQLTLPGTASPTIVYNTNVSGFVSNPPPSSIYTYGPHFVAPYPNSLPLLAVHGPVHAGSGP